MRGPHDREWNRCVIVASGPSLLLGDVDQIAAINAAQQRGWRVVVANLTFMRFPNADAMFGSDRSFWNKRHAAVRAQFKGECWTGDRNCAKTYGLKLVPLRWRRDRRTQLNAGLARDGHTITHNGNTGAHAVHLAWLFGMRRGVLVGFDFQHTNGQIHHHGPHTDGLSNPTPEVLVNWTRRFCVLARDLKENGTDLVNATYETALTCVPRVDLLQALQ